MALKYDELTFANDFLFCKILTSNPDVCCYLTELITGRKVGRIVSLNKQKLIEITSDGRGIRFDVYMEDDLDTVYNIEMQTVGIQDLPLLTRYYQGMIDLDLLERGSKFIELKKSYVLFICLDNLFPKIGLHKYTFHTTCKEIPSLELGDNAFKIILSAKGTADDVTEDLKVFLDYIAGKQPGSVFTQKLEDLVKKARDHVEWRKEYMTLLERDERMREEGRKEGLEIGLKEGREEGLKKAKQEAERADRAERLLAEKDAQIKELKAQISANAARVEN